MITTDGYNNVEYDGYMEQEEEWEREGLLDPAWEKQQKKVRIITNILKNFTNFRYSSVSESLPFMNHFKYLLIIEFYVNNPPNNITSIHNTAICKRSN